MRLRLWSGESIDSLRARQYTEPRGVSGTRGNDGGVTSVGPGETKQRVSGEGIDPNSVVIVVVTSSRPYRV